MMYIHFSVLILITPKIIIHAMQSAHSVAAALKGLFTQSSSNISDIPFSAGSSTPNPLEAPVQPSVLVLAPTRELCQQTADTCDRLVTELHSGAEAGTGGEATIKVACCVGGVDFHTQRRDILHRRPDLVVATPGRLLSLCGEIPASTRARQLQQGKSE